MQHPSSFVANPYRFVQPEPPRTAHVIDDDPAICRLAEAHLASADVEVKCYSSAEAFIEACNTAEATSRPCRGCVLLDLDLPGMSGSELQAQIAERSLAMPVLVLSGTADVATAVDVMKGGALDLIAKPFTAKQIINGVRRGLEEAARYERSAATLAELRRRYGKLTPREREVMGYVARGWANKQVAFELKLSERTVEVHRARVNQKMESESVAELVQQANTLGIIVENAAA